VAAIQLEQLTKVYSDGTRAVRELDLEVGDGEFVVFVGPSGCGKTTALRMIAGLEDITSGTVRVGGEVVNDLPPKARDMAMIFQNYALYPHMNAYDNMAFGLKMRGLDRGEIKRRVQAAAEILGLADVLGKRPRHLSGGQRQRVAMGRAIVREPAAFLMDEPLSNLDAKLRVQMRAEVSRIQRRLGVATLYVTHDQTEALTMGNRVAVLRAGVLQQCNKPQVLYDRPSNLFVAAFIGSPEMNLYEAALGEGASSLRLGSQELALPSSLLVTRPSLASYAGRSVVVGMRPEHLPAATSDIPGAVLKGDVTLSEGLGSQLLVHFTIDAPRVQSEDVRAAEEEQLSASEVASFGDSIALVDARVPITTGARASFAVDAERLHFFDPATGAAIS